MRPALGVEHKRQVRGERRALVLGHQGGKIILLHQPVQLRVIFFKKC